MEREILSLSPEGVVVSSDVLGVSNMFVVVYDPTGIRHDVFDVANHFGSIPYTAISDLTDVAIYDVGQDVPSGQHQHLPDIANMVKEVYDPNNVAMPMYDQASHVNQIPATLLSGSATRNIGTGSDDLAPGNHQHGIYFTYTIYDQNSKKIDGFLRSSHTGTQSVSTLTDTKDGMLLDVGTTTNSIAPGIHTHPYLRITYNATTHANKNVFNRESHIGVIPWSVISDHFFSEGSKGIVVGPTEPDTWLLGSGKWEKILYADTYANPGEPGTVKTVSNLGGEAPSYYLDRTKHFGTQPHTTIYNPGFIQISSRGLPNNQTSLGPTGKLGFESIATSTQLFIFGGFWDASTNTPTISLDTPPNTYFVVSVAGTIFFGDVGEWAVGDWLVRTTDTYYKISDSPKVSSVCNISDYNINIELHHLMGELPTVGSVAGYSGSPDYWSTLQPPNPLGTGDMYTSDHDPYVTGVIQNVSMFNTESTSYYLQQDKHTGDITVDSLGDWGDLATATFGTDAGNVSEGNHTHTQYLVPESNLSDLTSKELARIELEITDPSSYEYGTTLLHVAEGNHKHTAQTLFPNVTNFKLSNVNKQDLDDLVSVYPIIFNKPSRTLISGPELRTAPLNLHSYDERLLKIGSSITGNVSITLIAGVAYYYVSTISTVISLDHSNLTDGSTVKLFLGASTYTITISGAIKWVIEDFNIASSNQRYNRTNIVTFAKVGGTLYGSYVR